MNQMKTLKKYDSCNIHCSQPARRQTVTERRQLPNNSLDKVQHRCHHTLKYHTAAPLSSLAASENCPLQTGCAGGCLTCTWLCASLTRVKWSGLIGVPSHLAAILNLKNNNNPGDATWAGTTHCLATPTPATISQGVQRLPPAIVEANRIPCHASSFESHSLLSFCRAGPAGTLSAARAIKRERMKTAARFSGL